MRKPRPGSRWSRGRSPGGRSTTRTSESVARGRRSDAAGTPRWTSTHDSAPVCVACGCRWTLKSGQLHHVTYMRLGAEEPDDLVPLCATHHLSCTHLGTAPRTGAALGRSAATSGIIAVLRRRLEAPQRPEARTTAATTCRTIHPTAPNPGFVS